MSRVSNTFRGSISAVRRPMLFAGSAVAVVLAFAGSTAFAQSVDGEPAASDTGRDEVTLIQVEDVFTIGDGEHGVVGGVSGPLAVKAGSVITLGDFANGIATTTDSGLNSVTARAVETYGDFALGIVAQTLSGDISIAVDEVRTGGAVSDGVSAFTDTGDIDVRIGRVRTEGQDAWGLYAVSNFGAVRADVGRVETLRDGGIGLLLAGGGGASVTVDSILTSGYGAGGVLLSTGDFYNPIISGDAYLRARAVETRGAEAVGVSVIAIGKADVAVGTVRTYGELSDGVATYSGYGDARIVVEGVHTSGYGAVGVRSAIDEADLAMTVRKVVTEGDSAVAVRGLSRRGDLSITAGDLTTQGLASHGLIATAVNGDATVVAQGVIQTRGAAANGIMTAASGRTSITAADVRTSGANANGIDAFSGYSDTEIVNSRRIDIVAGSVSTEGANAHGIRVAMPIGGVIIAEAPRVAPRGPVAPSILVPDDTVSIKATKVAVLGEGAVGILAQGQGAVIVQADAVSSRLGEAIVVDAQQDATLTLTGPVTGGGAAAVRVAGEDITLTVAKTGVVTGARDAVVLSAQGPYVPPTEPFANAAASQGVSTLDNAGVIRAGSGAAVRVTSGTAVINNSGRIEGSLILGDGDDRVVNTGTLVVTANNDFGTGDDLFTNRGVVQFGKASAPLNLSFLGLERFANEGGLIDLRNERAGDTLTLSGAYAASGNARLALDVGPTAFDSFVVTGAATGKTSILLQGRAEDATLLDKGVQLITVGQGSTAAAFSLANAELGLVRYGLTYDSTTRAYMLNASAGRAVRQSVRAGEGLISAWRASADAFDAEQAMARASGGDPRRVWAQAWGSRAERDGDETGRDSDYEEEAIGGQLGVSSAALELGGGQAVVGLTAGYGDSTLSFDDAGQTVDIRTLNAGAYGAWRSGALFATGLVKVDSHSLEIDDRAAGFQAEIDGLSWGVQVAAGRRFDLGAFALEPTVGLEYLSTSLDDLNVLKQTVSFEDHQGLAARVGARAIARSEFADGRALVWTAGVEAIHDFDAEYEGTLHGKTRNDTARVNGAETSALGRIGVQYEVGGGLETYIQGEGRFGDSETGGGVRIGARYRF